MAKKRSEEQLSTRLARLHEMGQRGKRLGRFAALAAPSDARRRRWVLASSTQVDSVVPTVPDSGDAVQVDRDGEAEFIDTENNRIARHRQGGGCC